MLVEVIIWITILTLVFVTLSFIISGFFVFVGYKAIKEKKYTSRAGVLKLKGRPAVIAGFLCLSFGILWLVFLIYSLVGIYIK